MTNNKKDQIPEYADHLKQDAKYQPYFYSDYKITGIHVLIMALLQDG